MTTPREAHIVVPADITDEFADWFYDSAIDGWYEDSGIDWEDALKRVEGVRGMHPTLGELDFGDSMISPTVLKLQRKVRAIRRENGY